MFHVRFTVCLHITTCLYMYRSVESGLSTQRPTIWFLEFTLRLICVPRRDPEMLWLFPDLDLILVDAIWTGNWDHTAKFSCVSQFGHAARHWQSGMWIGQHSLTLSRNVRCWFFHRYWQNWIRSRVKLPDWLCWPVRAQGLNWCPVSQACRMRRLRAQGLNWCPVSQACRMRWLRAQGLNWCPVSQACRMRRLRVFFSLFLFSMFFPVVFFHHQTDKY